MSGRRPRRLRRGGQRVDAEVTPDDVVAGVSGEPLRLAQLTSADLLRREVDAGPPVSVRYQLAPKGVALVPVLQELIEWARGNLESAPAHD